MKIKSLLAMLPVLALGVTAATQASAQALPRFSAPSYGYSVPKNNNTAIRAHIAKNNRNLANQYRAGLLDRFITYTTYNSQSSEMEAITPEQIETANKLYAEISKFGFKTVLTKEYYLYVEIPSNVDWETPTLGFSCHYDTTPDIAGTNIKAQKIENYNGNPIVLRNGHTIDFNSDPYLKNMIGKTIVTSDGTTMLSADDKAGVAIVTTFIQTLAENPNKKHGRIQIILAPNEDVGRAAEHIEKTPYNPDIAFDFDGGVNSEVVVGNFNAVGSIYTVQGVPGHQSAAATNGYRNAWYPLSVLAALALKEEWLPNNSSGKQGYVELHHMNPINGSSAQMDLRLRDFSMAHIDSITNHIDSIAEVVAKKLDVVITSRHTKQYGNVAESVHPQAKQVVLHAFQNAGLTPDFREERAGTTAAMFTLKGLKGAYTIFTGQNNPHSFTEWLSEEDMFKAYLVALNLADEVVMLK